MERKDILAILCAVGVVILVMGVLGMVREGKMQQEESVPIVPATTAQAVPVQTTDIWDEVRALQAAKETTTETEALPLNTAVAEPDDPALTTNVSDETVTEAVTVPEEPDEAVSTAVAGISGTGMETGAIITVPPVETESGAESRVPYVIVVPAGGVS